MAAATAVVSSVLSDSVWPHRWQPTRLPCPWDLQARTREWVAIFFSNACMHAKSLQSRPTLCDPMNSSPPGSSVHGILWARILEWADISFSSHVATQLWSTNSVVITPNSQDLVTTSFPIYSFCLCFQLRTKQRKPDINQIGCLTSI